MKKILISILAVFLHCNISAQQLFDRTYRTEKHKEAIEYANKHNLPVYKVHKDGSIISLQYLDKFGWPVYYKTLNANAAFTTSTNQLYSNGRLGLNLSGEGLTVGVWDGGSVKANHIELIGRTQQLDNPKGVSEHSTHVTGTILATGLNPAAKGMAFKANSFNFDFNTDDPEMKEQAEKGLLLSNHSYGLSLGWEYDPSNNSWKWNGDADVSAVEDYRFGLYTQASKSWDQIAYDNPYYLIIKSAGNDRSDVGNGTGAPGDGPYDILDPQAVAKNILTVGAVESLTEEYTGPSDIKMTNFSSWGPTDDGRIKPDIVGAGSNVLSTSSSSNDAYTTLSGTSMSAPNVTGSLLLLQELSKRLNDKYLKAATLKALVIQTAREAGSKAGPDYQFGWGLLNAEGAAQLLLMKDNSTISVLEDSLVDQEILTKTFEVKKLGKYSLTLAWTDIPGKAESEQVLDPEDLRLVNDLDMKVISPSGDIFLPWVINPLSKNVSKGDNIRDNIEKINFDAIETGKYTVQISHKGNLTQGKQDFSLVISPENVQFGTLYYVGGATGVWSNPNNWSEEPHGASAGRIPTSLDVVQIGSDDLKSIEIDLNGDQECFALSSKDSTSVNLNLNDHILRVASHLTISNPNFKLQEGEIDFSNNLSLSSGLIECEANSFKNINLVIDSNDYSLNLTGSLSVDSLIFKAGEFNARNTYLTVNHLSSSSDKLRSLNLENSTITINSIVQEGLNFNIESDNSKIILDGAISKINFDQDSIVLHNITMLADSNQLIGNFLINKLEARKSTVIYNRIGVDTLVIDGKLFLNPQVDSTIVEIGNSLLIDPTDQTRVELIGLDKHNTLVSNGNNKFCLDSMNVNNVNVRGETFFVLGENSAVVNSEGWIQNNCEDVLSADFDYKYICASGLTEFYDRSDGNPASWSWDFGDGTTSDLQNPVHSFSNPGLYTVTFTVMSEGLESNVEQAVEIIPGALGNPTIIEKSGNLESTAFAKNYQWYLNDLEVQGKTDYFLENVTESGDYFIDIWNDNCKKRSPAYTFEITGIYDSTDLYLRLFPNPVDGLVSIRSNDACNLTIIDTTGKFVYKDHLDATGDDLIINVKSWKSGIYIVKMLPKNGDIKIIKLIINH